MNLQQLKAKGGIVDGALVKKEVTWVHADPATGKDVTDKFSVHMGDDEPGYRFSITDNGPRSGRVPPGDVV